MIMSSGLLRHLISVPNNMCACRRFHFKTIVNENISPLSSPPGDPWPGTVLIFSVPLYDHLDIPLNLWVYISCNDYGYAIAHAGTPKNVACPSRNNPTILRTLGVFGWLTDSRAVSAFESSFRRLAILLLLDGFCCIENLDSQPFTEDDVDHRDRTCSPQNLASN